MAVVGVKMYSYGPHQLSMQNSYTPDTDLEGKLSADGIVSADLLFVTFTQIRGECIYTVFYKKT